MKLTHLFLVFFSVLLAACDAPVDQKMVSTVPASAQQFSEAQKAAAVCGRHAPNWVAASQSLKSIGYHETEDPRLASIQKSQRAVILEKTGTDVVVLLGASGGEGACIVGLEGMTPQQSLELAKPWVKTFGVRTNAERGQGLAKNAVEAWGTIEENRVVYIAAFKTWDVLDAPGAAARLLYIQR
ncbi:hypothetical protein [Thalassovita sp.]|uniref:hypothetical protein n=1 Tax=Thalassovita sp. TaxID=1979401 RepID=UPI002AAF70D4|nr:hypothetical protein [Thalassovita sp.]